MIKILYENGNLSNLEMYNAKSTARSYISQGYDPDYDFDIITKNLENEGRSNEYVELVLTKMRNFKNKEFSYRIDYYGSWDNGRVLHSFKKATLDRAEEDAKRASIKDSKNLYYVVLDDIMDPTTGWCYYKGKAYSDSDPELDSIKRAINNSKVESYKRPKKVVMKESNKSKYDIAYNIASFVFGSPYSKDIDDNIDFLVRQWFKQTTPDYKDRLYMCDTVDELASVLSEAPLRILQSTEIGLCIDDATIYGESFNRRKIYENDNYNYHYDDMEYTIPFVTQQKAKEFGDWLQLSVIKGGKPDILCKSWYWEPVDGDMGQLKVIADDFTISLITMQVYRKGLVPEDTHWPSFVKFVEDSGKPVH